MAMQRYINRITGRAVFLTGTKPYREDVAFWRRFWVRFAYGIALPKRNGN